MSFDGKTLAYGGGEYSDFFLVFRNVNRVWLKTKVFCRAIRPNIVIHRSNKFLSDDGKTIATASKYRQPTVFHLQNGMWVENRGIVPFFGADRVIRVVLLQRSGKAKERPQRETKAKSQGKGLIP